MKKLVKLSLPAILCLIFSLSCNAQDKRLFDKLTKFPCVESTYLEPEAESNGKVNDIDIDEITSGMMCEITAIETITAESEDKKPLEKIKAEVAKILKKQKATVVMENIDGDGSTVIYTITDSKGKDAGNVSFIFITSDATDYNLTHIAGKTKTPAQEQN